MPELSSEKRALLAKQFRHIDINKDGYIDATEFSQLLHAMGEGIPDETLCLQFTVIDANDDGVVSFDEFIGWWTDYC